MTESERVFHPAANIFPLMAGEEFDRLCEDIEANGQREPIWLHPDGTILDGRNRHRACTRLGIEPVTKEWDGGGSAVSFVLSLNLHRRHLDESQRAIVAAKGKAIFEEEAKARERLSNSSKANLPDSVKGQSRDKAAELLNVSPRSVESAAKVLREGVPELVEAVEQGKVAVSTAAIITKVPRPEQREIVARGEREILAAAKAIKAARVAANSDEAFEDDGDEWYTPADIVEAARATMNGIDLDPACSDAAKTVVKATACFTKAEDGLSRPWFGRVFLNPPYSMPLIERFVDKLLSEFDAGNVSQAVVVVNNSTDTGWFHALLAAASCVCLTRGRLKFWRPDRPSFSARQGQAIFYLGGHHQAFINSFGAAGKTLRAA